jgi:hypothetical protein
MEIKEFWVVTKPTEDSTVADICFKSTPQKIGLQFFGGLKADDVIGFFDCGDQAESLAYGLLQHFEKWRRKP